MFGRIYEGDHFTLLHVHLNMLALGLMVSEEKNFKFFVPLEFNGSYMLP